MGIRNGAEEIINVVVGSDGSLLPVDSTPQSLSYTNGVLDYIEVTVGSKTYRQTLTYTSGVLTSVGKWVLQ